jgi:hypothetical protein
MGGACWLAPSTPTCAHACLPACLCTQVCRAVLDAACCEVVVAKQFPEVIV